MSGHKLFHGNKKIRYLWPSLARSVLKPLNVPSLARSVPKPLKVPSLARSVPKPLLIELREAGGHKFL